MRDKKTCSWDKDTDMILLKKLNDFSQFNHPKFSLGTFMTLALNGRRPKHHVNNPGGFWRVLHTAGTQIFIAEVPDVPTVVTHM